MEEILMGLNCLKDKLSDENDDLFRLIQENREEINHIKLEKQNYREINNISGIQQLYNVSPIEFIKKKLINEDLTSHSKFRKFLRPQVNDSFICLKVLIINVE